ncbi:MAG: hypothetical protein IKR40_08820 [Treponema sp.]|nr:hypothetical protein [Treponema sp.]
MNIPMNGIPDGRYMIFAKASDTYGNFNYITLGKADIGTFINKLKASWKTTDSKIQIVSTLPIESTERFDRNMINIQGLDTSNGNWWDKYGWANELLPCTETTEGGKTVLHYETPTGPTAQIVDSYDKEHGTWTQKTEGLEIARWWYRITMQSFNQNSLEYDNDLKIVTKDGANRKYRRPYGDTDGDGQVTYDYIQNISKYDLFTEETVSNTVYLFIPFDDNYLDGIKSSFFPSTSTPRSNKCFIVNVISASRDLGRAPDEWERRGKLIYTHYYDPGDTSNYTQFNESVAADDMFNSNEKGLVYYVAVVHFADGSMAISKTYTMQGM